MTDSAVAPGPVSPTAGRESSKPPAGRLGVPIPLDDRRGLPTRSDAGNRLGAPGGGGSGRDGFGRSRPSPRRPGHRALPAGPAGGPNAGPMVRPVRRHQRRVRVDLPADGDPAAD